MEKEFEYQYGEFKCDVEIYANGNQYMFRFFNKEEQLTEGSDLVIVPTDYGYVNASFIRDICTYSGYLDRKYFNVDMIDNLIGKIDKLINAETSYYHIELVELKDYAEYNGEY